MASETTDRRMSILAEMLENRPAEVILEALEVFGGEIFAPADPPAPPVEPLPEDIKKEALETKVSSNGNGHDSTPPLRKKKKRSPKRIEAGANYSTKRTSVQALRDWWTLPRAVADLPYTREEIDYFIKQGDLAQIDISNTSMIHHRQLLKWIEQQIRLDVDESVWREWGPIIQIEKKLRLKPGVLNVERNKKPCPFAYYSPGSGLIVVNKAEISYLYH